ncbi:AAA family ATPase [Sorangium sp. So ce341]|uniref:AAA family ATPase n=1 Tax=Sorangium sp. So ce341 TaxID=3133302 RepID=UPI003F63ABAA
MTRAPEGARWRLHAINIRHFRGVAGERTVRFDGMPGLLHGKNGVGKSTVAQCLQWALYGRFPQNVLANVSLARFLAPVEGKKKAYCGEVVFQRGTERLVLRRDEAEGCFTLTSGSRCYRDEEAEAKRDELLGLDMDTFVRSVLLQQNRIRGLLLDEPRDRNKALDRLLGMDALEQLVPVVQSDKFANAARAWRSCMASDERNFEAKDKLLNQQREVAERIARDEGFKAKDFTRLGLQQAYAAVAERLASTATRYGVEIDALPPCDAAAKAAATHGRVMKALQTIRLRSKLTQQLRPVQARLMKLYRLQETWSQALGARNDAAEPVAAWVKKNGEKEDVVAAKGRIQKEIKMRKKALTDADALYQLLHDAHAYTERREVETCPVCDQAVPRGVNLTTALSKRMKALTSRVLNELGNAVETLEQQVSTIETKLQDRADLDSALARTQRSVHSAQREVAKELEFDALAEPKVTKRIENAIARLEKEEKTVKDDLEIMEEELMAIQALSHGIQVSLVPLVQKREEQAAHEAEWKKRQAAHEEDSARAARMEGCAVQLDQIRTALLRAKDEIATESLDRAGPRAAELYRKLVRHPRFDTLRLATQRRKLKVDYAFEVSIDGASRTALEARLALSDGQLTATALGVFFALAESTAHGLDLLYVDDPTQNLDLPCKEAMAKVIAEIAQRKQVIVATHDDDFVGMLDDQGFNERAYVHHIPRWDGDPTYETTSPAVGATRGGRATTR